MRLIDEAALINEAETGGWDIDLKELRMILKYVPTIDAVPVVRGRWAWVQYDGNPKIGNWHCSACRYIPKATSEAQTTPYCPNCGCDMRGESNVKE